MLIYNLFPRLVGELTRWPEHTARARKMAFDWIYLNPVQYPGFSGSLYAIKDHYRLNPLFEPVDVDPKEALREAVAAMHEQGLKVMIDLVVNHTSKDSDLIKAHPQWFRRDAEGYLVSPSAIDPADTNKVTVWGDLAEVDNAKSADRSGLWAYWTAMTQHLLDVGFDGFRCDAAYKVPSGLWEQLIRAARKRNPDVVFVAETLGCRLPEARALRECGFDYFCNSNKWWNFDKPWCLKQHAEFAEVAPSVGFPESHDTPRLMEQTGGLVAVQKQRYAFAAAFSEGLLMPIGYEFGFVRKLDVVSTLPEHWEQTDVDLTRFVTTVNQLKRDNEMLRCEGSWELVTTYDAPTIVLCKRDAVGSKNRPLLVVINKDWHQPQSVKPPKLSAFFNKKPPRLYRLCRQDTTKPAEMPANNTLHLDPAEVAYLL